MPTSLAECAQALAAEGVRHHLDVEEQAIRVAFLTRHYRNLRGERLAIVRIEAPDEGHRCRVSIERAFAVGDDAAAACERFCRLAAAMPLVGVEFDADREDLRMVAEMPVEDGALSRLQLLSMIDRIVEAAEAWHFAAAAGRRGTGRDVA
jgi:hypothetical protein